jgi:hypothetical protein
MKLDQLTDDEETVLLGWMREIVQTDDDYSEEERAEVARLKGLIGDERFERAIARAKARFPTRAALKEAAKEITRPEARRAMYDYLRTLAESDELLPEEEKPLRWLASWWKLEG